MEFHHDAQHDVVTAHFEACVLETPEDAVRWREEVEVCLARFQTKVDLLINLDGLNVKFAAGRAFGRERSAVLERFSNRSFRYGGDQTTRTFVSTSGMITGADVNAYATREEALQALLVARSRENAVPQR
jgi:hypothetical protein